MKRLFFITAIIKRNLLLSLIRRELYTYLDFYAQKFLSKKIYWLLIFSVYIFFLSCIITALAAEAPIRFEHHRLWADVFILNVGVFVVVTFGDLVLSFFNIEYTHRFKIYPFSTNEITTLKFLSEFFSLKILLLIAFFIFLPIFLYIYDIQFHAGLLLLTYLSLLSTYIFACFLLILIKDKIVKYLRKNWLRGYLIMVILFISYFIVPDDMLKKEIYRQLDFVLLIVCTLVSNIILFFINWSLERK